MVRPFWPPREVWCHRPALVPPLAGDVFTGRHKQRCGPGRGGPLHCAAARVAFLPPRQTSYSPGSYAIQEHVQRYPAGPLEFFRQHPQYKRVGGTSPPPGSSPCTLCHHRDHSRLPSTPREQLAVTHLSLCRLLAVLSPPARLPALLPTPLRSFLALNPAMARTVAVWVLLALVVALVLAQTAAASTRADRVAGERRVWRVVMEHLNALNKCSVRRLMAQHPYVGRVLRSEE